LKLRNNGCQAGCRENEMKVLTAETLSPLMRPHNRLTAFAL
jgi:hypothetical protein